MADRLRKWWNYKKFTNETRQVLMTPPLKPVDGPLAVVSMVAKDDAQMYILAIKALYRSLGFGKLVAIIDADTPMETLEVIEQHLGRVEFVTLESVDTGPCQRGGTWERVLYVVERSAREYVIQVDCDTLVFGDAAEVRECVKDNVAFTMASTMPRKPLYDWVAEGNKSSSRHIVMETERKFGEYPGGEGLYYIRGTSGFAGFAKGGVKRALVEEFHVKMDKILGARWREWGTEQVASNFAVANSPGGLCLPNPKYRVYAGQQVDPATVALHFIGTFRFQNGVFASLGKRVIAELQRRG